MKKTVKIFSVVLAIVILVTSLTSCGGNKVSKNDIIGQWYSDSGEMEIDVRKDGTYDDRGYGTGTWKYLDDGVTVEFTDFYGYTKTTTVIKDDYGYSIYNGRYYRDFYPNLVGETNEIPTNEIPTNDYNNQQITGIQKVSVDAFTGIKYEVTGISPYCKISINNSGCSADAQQRVTYSFDKEYYANGDKAIITATLSANTSEKDYILESSEIGYDLAGQAEYVSSEQQFDIEFIKKEVSDKVTALISSSIGTNGICNVSDQRILDYETRLSGANFFMRNGITKVEPTHIATYFSCLKEQKKPSMNAYLPYNRCSYVYCFDVYGDVNNVICHGKLYVTITAENIVKLPNGSLSWNNEKCDFKVDTGVDGFDNCVSNTIMSYSDNYNITKIEL